MLKVMNVVIVPVVTSMLFLVGPGMLLSMLFARLGMLELVRLIWGPVTAP
jgi:hypothetical protein